MTDPLVSTYVSEYSPIEDDPMGVLEQINDIKLVPTGASRAVFKNRLPATKRIRSPLVTSKVISGSETDDDSNVQDTVKSLLASNTASMNVGNAAVNEEAISKMIEAGQRSVLTTDVSPRNPPMNYTNQDPVNSLIQQNSLSVFTDFDFDDVGLARFDTTARNDFYSRLSTRTPTQLHSYDSLLTEKTGRFVSLMVCAFFLFVHGFRVVSDVWIVELVQATIRSKLQIGIYGVFSAGMLLGVLGR